MLKAMSSVFLLFLISIMLSACVAPVKETKKPDQKQAPEIVVQPVEVKEAEPVIEQPEQQDVLILLSSSANTYQKVANYLASSLGEHAVQITLSGLPAQDKAVIEDIKVSGTHQIVAIGLKAAEAVKGIEDKQIIFTQVITYKKLMLENMHGVSALPSPEKLFADWKKLSPGLSKVAVVSGNHLDLYLTRAKAAAKAQGIALTIELVNSDKGFIYKSKKLKSDVGGQWILPDNRILSGKALKEVMAYSSRRGRQIVVFSPKLLSFGGFFYVSPNLEMIAQGVLKRLKELTDKNTQTAFSVLPVMDHNMGINKNIARQLNLTIPPEYRNYINEN